MTEQEAVDIWKDPIFEAGQTVVCRNPSGYNFKEGKEYTVVKYEPRYPDLHFTWPAYIHVMNDGGDLVCCHARRFAKQEVTDAG